MSNHASSGFIRFWISLVTYIIINLDVSDYMFWFKKFKSNRSVSTWVSYGRIVLIYFFRFWGGFKFQTMTIADFIRFSNDKYIRHRKLKTSLFFYHYLVFFFRRYSANSSKTIYTSTCLDVTWPAWRGDRTHSNVRTSTIIVQ
jgi:hypothetical protein